jgi:hypothetical protein
MAAPLLSTFSAAMSSDNKQHFSSFSGGEVWLTYFGELISFTP